MRAAEGGEEVVHGILVADVDCCKARTPLVAVSVEQIVVPDGNVKQIAPGNARRIAIVILRPGRGIFNLVDP